jgi:6,7-dimethyl-8-ribityllumazine synthase
MPKIHQGNQSVEGMKFAIVVSRYNQDLTEALLKSALDAFMDAGVKDDAIHVAHVPGAFEIPLMAKRFALSGTFSAVVCLGAILRGQTYHFELVAGQTAQAIMNISLETKVPIIFSVMAIENKEQGLARIEYGYAGAKAAIEMSNLSKILDHI